MYSIKPTSDVPNIRPICKIGYPENTYADLCIVSVMMPAHNIPVNSVVLREALLSNVEFIEQALSIKIVDVKGLKQAKPKPKPKPKPQTKAKPKETTPVKEEETPVEIKKVPKKAEDDEAWK